MREHAENHKAVPQRGRGLALPWSPRVSLVLGVGQSPFTCSFLHRHVGWLWLVLDVALQNNIPEWQKPGCSQGRVHRDASWSLPMETGAAALSTATFPHGVPSFTEHLLNGRVDFSFPGSGSSTLTKTTNTSYHQIGQHVQQEHRVMGSSSLTRDYSTMLMGHGEYCGVGACPSLPSP